MAFLVVAVYGALGLLAYATSRTTYGREVVGQPPQFCWWC